MNISDLLRDSGFIFFITYCIELAQSEVDNLQDSLDACEFSGGGGDENIA